MRVIAIDTAAEFGSLALVEDGVVLAEQLLHSPDGFAHVMFPQLERLVSRHGWRLDAVDGYVAGAGPGSFTGVRVALAAVKGLAEAAGCRAAAVSNLRAVAAYGSAPLRAPYYDARRGEIYGGLYSAALEPVGEESVGPLPAWLSTLPAGAERITTQPDLFPGTAAPRALAGQLGLLGAAMLVDPVMLDANYIRRSDAELKLGQASFPR